MNPKKVREEQLSPEEREAIRSMAEGIARGDGIDPVTVTRVFMQAVTKVDLATKRFYFGPDSLDIDEAIEHLGQQRALELFESSDLEKLGKRLGFARVMADSRNSIYSLSDWRKGLASLIDYQSKNGEELVETGYSTATIDTSEWLDWTLGCLLPTKLRFPELKGSCWRKSLVSKPGFEPTPPWAPCGYSEADHVWFLDKPGIERINDGLRGRLLRFREIVFRFLVERITSHDTTGNDAQTPIETALSCLRAGTGVLSQDDLEFLRDIDNRFLENLNRHGSDDPNMPSVRPGGMLDLLDILARVTWELATGVLGNIRNKLAYWRIEPPRLGVQFDLSIFYSDYASGGGRWFDEQYEDYKEYPKTIESHFVAVKTAFESLFPEIGSAKIGQIKTHTNFDDVREPQPELILHDIDSSVQYKGKHISLPEKHYKAIWFMAKRHMEGDTSIQKHVIYQFVDEMTEGELKKPLAGWFKGSKGKPRRLAETGLFKLSDYDMWSLDVPPKAIEIVPSIGDESSEDESS